MNQYQMTMKKLQKEEWVIKHFKKGVLVQPLETPQKEEEVEK